MTITSDDLDLEETILRSLLRSGQDHQAKATILAARRIGDGLQSIAFWLKHLGNGDAATPMGGLEALGAVQKEGLDSISSSLQDGLTRIAQAIDDHSDHKSR